MYRYITMSETTPVIMKAHAIPKPTARPRKNPTPEELKAMTSSQRSYYKNREKCLDLTKKYVETPEGRANSQRVVRKYQQKQRDEAKRYRELMAEKEAAEAAAAAVLAETLEEISTQELEAVCEECEKIMGEMIEPKKKRASRKKKVVDAGTQTDL